MVRNCLLSIFLYTHSKFSECCRGDIVIRLETNGSTTTNSTIKQPTTSYFPTTSEAPTTEVPTTEVPTTEAPTTEAPTTDVPTTDFITSNKPSTTTAVVSSKGKNTTIWEKVVVTG